MFRVMQRAMRLAAVVAGVAILLTLADPSALYAGKKEEGGSSTKTTQHSRHSGLFQDRVAQSTRRDPDQVSELLLLRQVHPHCGEKEEFVDGPHGGRRNSATADGRQTAVRPVDAVWPGGRLQGESVRCRRQS